MNRRRRNNVGGNVINTDNGTVNTESVLIHEYIGLMTNVLNCNLQVTRSFNNNVSSILSNVNILFDNYYRWGREQHGRSRSSQTTRNSTESIYNWGTFPTTFNSTTAPRERSWADIVSEGTTRRRPPTRMRNRRQSRRAQTTIPTTRPPGNLTNRVISRPNTFQTFLNNTLHTTGFTQYTLTREQIDDSLTTMAWSEIRSSTDQSVCPINQIAFVEGDMICRINECGHIFSTNAINNYLLNYDTRCPVCRLDLRQNVNSSTLEQSNTTPETTFPSTRTPATTFPSTRTPETTFPSTRTSSTRTPATTIPSTTSNTRTQTEDSLTTNINNAVNLASNAFVNELTNSLFGTAPIPAQLNAEYSLFLPNQTGNSTSTNSTFIPPTPPLNSNSTFTWSNTTNYDALSNNSFFNTPLNTETKEADETKESDETKEADESKEADETKEAEENTTNEYEEKSESDASRYISTYVEGTLNIPENNENEELNSSPQEDEEKKFERIISSRK